MRRAAEQIHLQEHGLRQAKPLLERTWSSRARVAAHAMAVPWWPSVNMAASAARVSSCTLALRPWRRRQREAAEYGVTCAAGDIQSVLPAKPWLPQCVGCTPRHGGAGFPQAFPTAVTCGRGLGSVSSSVWQVDRGETAERWPCDWVCTF